MLRRTDIREAKILTADPVGGLILGSGACIVIVHGSKIGAVHPQVNHVGAVCIDLIFQLVSVIDRIVNSMSREVHTVIVILAVPVVTQCDQTAAGTTVQVVVIGKAAGIVR